MPVEAAEATSTINDVAGMFDQAFRAMADSFKVAMKAQEDAVKFWSDAVGKVNPLRAVTGDVIPTAQKNADEYLRLLESSYRRNADLIKKAIRPGGGDGGGLEQRTREWLDASLDAARENAQDLASTNLRVAQAWTEAFKKGAQQGAQFSQQVAQGTPTKVPLGK